MNCSLMRNHPLLSEMPQFRDSSIRLKHFGKPEAVFSDSYEGIETGSPKGTIRGFFQTGYLTDAQTKCALEMLDDRNLTSHTYNEALSEQIFQKLPEYAVLMDSWLSSMSEKLK